MTRFCCTLVTRPKKSTNCQKRRVGCSRSRVKRVVVMGKSMAGLEGKNKGKTMLLRVFVV